MNNITLLCSILIFGQVAFAARNLETSAITIKSVECDINPNYGQDIICKHRPVRNKLGSIHLYGILNVTIHEMYLSVHQYYKNSANIYQRGPVQFTEDLCKLTANADGLLFKFIPILKEYGEKLKIMHPCPYYPQIFDLGVIVVPKLPNLFTAAHPTGDYKALFRVSNTRNETIYQIMVAAFFRGSSLFSKF